MKNKSTKHILLCPGPVNLAENVRKAAINSEIGHREEEFSTLLKRINKKILSLFSGSTKKYYPVVITGSGTAANEAIYSSVIGNKRVLVISNGEFGERIYNICSFHNPNTYLLKLSWGQSINPKLVEKYIKIYKIETVATVHHETSTGMLNPIEKIGKITKKYKVEFIVDAVSSLGAEKIDLEKSNIFFLSTSSSKAIASLPGLSIVIGRKSEFEKLKNIPAKTIYLNLYKFYQYSKDYKQTPNTPAVSAFFALEQALSNIANQGIDKRIKRLKYLANYLRKGLKKQGLEFLINERQMCSVLTTVIAPDYMNVNDLRNKLKKKSIIIYAGKGPLTDKVFQVANIGEVSKKELDLFLFELARNIKQTKKPKADEVVRFPIKRFNFGLLTHKEPNSLTTSLIAVNKPALKIYKNNNIIKH